jgi:(p)ppGpp synthase/HD superfamily hydrolase
MSKMAKTIKLCDRLSNLRNSRVTRPPDALRRYLEQTDRILELVPRSVSPRVWDAVKALAEQVAREVA